MVPTRASSVKAVSSKPAPRTKPSGESTSRVTKRSAKGSYQSNSAFTGGKKSSTSSPSPKTTKIKSITAYSPKFTQHLSSHGIYLDGYDRPCGKQMPKPKNFDNLHDILSRSRRAVSPTDLSADDFQKFKFRDTIAVNESGVIGLLIPTMDGSNKNRGSTAMDHLCSNLASMTDDTLVIAKPDLLYGARPEQLNRLIRDDLDDMIVPSTYKHFPMLPNFFLEVKGPDGSPAVAARQACHDGAIGARGIHALQSYKNDSPVYDKNAYTITATYQCGHLRLYTTHIEPPADANGRPEYVMTSLCSYSMVNSLETFRQAVTTYRNLRDWAKEQRDASITAANARFKDAQNQLALEELQGS
ncbi:hypothetical protein MauCBS54593_003824 [Microsporum audouinii]